MPKIIKLDERILEEKIKKANEKLGGAYYRFYERLQEADKEYAGRPSENTFYSGIAFESFIGISTAVRSSIEHLYSSDGSRKNEFLNIYSAYIASTAMSEAMNSNGLEHVKASDACLIDFSQNPYVLNYKTFIENYLLGIGNGKPQCGEDIAVITKRYFNWIRNSALNKKNEFQEYVNVLVDYSVQVNNLVFDGFSFSETVPEKKAGHDEHTAGEEAQNDAQEQHQNLDYGVSLDDIVGNSRLKCELKKAVENLLCYNPEKKENIVKKYCDFPQTFLVVGSEGTGKTSTIEAVISHGYRIASRNCISFKYIKIDNSFKSEYYSASMRNLKNLLAPIFSGDSAYIVSLEDIDTLLFSRDSHNPHHEDISILGELMNFLEGVGTANFGNYIVIATTNKMLNLDSALSSRLKQNVILSTGPEILADYEKLFKSKLSKMIQIESVDWKCIGELCLSQGISGRGVKNICMQINSQYSEFEKPENWFRLNDSGKEKVLSGRAGQLNEEMLKNSIVQYSSIEKEKENEERKKRIDGMADMIEDEIAAKKIIVDKFQVEPAELVLESKELQNSGNGVSRGC